MKTEEDKAKNIIISGGRIRGVLFGVYYFLDRKLGVHWYSPYDEYVPKANAIKVDNLPYIGKPTFDDIPLSDLEIFHKNLLKHILEEKETNLKENKQ